MVAIRDQLAEAGYTVAHLAAASRLARRRRAEATDAPRSRPDRVKRHIVGERRLVRSVCRRLVYVAPVTHVMVRLKAWILILRLLAVHDIVSIKCHMDQLEGVRGGAVGGV